MAEPQRSTAMPTALSGGKGDDLHPLPLTRAWVEDYRRWFAAQLRAPAVLAEKPELATLHDLEPRLVEQFKAADRGRCHCGGPGLYVEQKANGWAWYCDDHRPNYRACHICGQSGVAFEYACDRWLWYCEAHSPVTVRRHGNISGSNARPDSRGYQTGAVPISSGCGN